MRVCVHIQWHMGCSCLLLVAYSCLVYENQGPRGVVSLCFTGLVILLSGLGGHAKDLLAVCIKMFIRSLSGLALQTSVHGLTASQALRLTFGAGGVWSGSSVACSRTYREAQPSQGHLQEPGVPGPLRVLAESSPHCLFHR